MTPQIPPRRSTVSRSLLGGLALISSAFVAASEVHPPVAGASASDWTVYHGDPAGDGVDSSGVSFASPTVAWTSATLDGQLYGEPLELGGRVYVATENDTVYALSVNNGAVLWSTHVGTPVPNNLLACAGDIAPTVGITGTPVLDGSSNEIFVVADELSGGSVRHHLLGLSLDTGSPVLDEVVDPAGSDPTALLQRTGLNIDQGNVVFGYGGNAGDCGNYHGWVISAPTAGGGFTTYAFDGASGQREGAVWMGGAAPEVDGSGNIWVAVGNGSVTSGISSQYDGSDSVTELSPGLNRLQYFAPATWGGQNATDQDLGSTAPALVGNGTVLQVGKSQTAYLLSRGNLGNINGELTSSATCSGFNADGGDAVSGSVVYVPCQGGVEAISTSLSPPSVQVQWQAHVGGPPIIAGGYVWSIGGGNLDALDPASGTVVHQFAVGSEANHFPTPSVGDGLLLAPESNRVLALAGSAATPPPPPPPPSHDSYWLAGSDGGLFAFGNARFYGSMGGQPLNQPIVAMAATPDGGGYWLMARDGGVFAFGDAAFFGSMGGQPLDAPMVGLAPTPDGRGYWAVAADGGVFAFGDASFYGSMGGRPLNAPIVGIAAAPSGGYWLVAQDGGIFAFGSARFAGSMGGQPLNQPVVGLAPDPASGGYWEVAADGGVFAFAAPFFGSTGGLQLNAPVVGMTATPDGAGYWFVASDGGIFSFGDAGFSGSMGGSPLAARIVGMASRGI